MGTGLVWFAGAVCFATLSVVFRFALQSLEDDAYRASWGWFFLSLVVLGVIALLWARNGDASVMAKNIILGLIGAAIGGSGLIYAGDAFGDAKGKLQSQVSGAEIPLTQFAQNVTSYGQQGGITAGTVNMGSQRLAFSSELGS
jgi:hypothetical protein